MKQERGVAINEVVSELAFRTHLRKLAEHRERQAKRYKRKEACTAATEQTSKGLCPNKTYNNYTTDKEACQDGTSRNPPGREIGQQSRQPRLPVYLL